MHTRLILILLCLLLTMPTLAQDNTPTEAPRVPNLIGLRAPEAHRLLNERGLNFDPIILSTNRGAGELNRIIDQSPSAGESVDEGATVSITILRENNIELIWNTEEWADQAFTIVNLTDTQINLKHLQFQSADSSRTLSSAEFPAFLRERQCVQLWSFSESNGSRLPECQFLQGGGVLTVTATNQQFWRVEDSLTLWQNGLQRAECEISAGRCQLWLSPTELAEELSPYVFISYTEHELLVYNRSENFWLPIAELALNDGRALNDSREWDSLSFDESFPYLAPNQCLRFGDGTSTSSHIDCAIVASRTVSQNAVFWREDFTLHSLRDSDVSKTCPAAIGQTPSICMVLR